MKLITFLISFNVLILLIGLNMILITKSTRQDSVLLDFRETISPKCPSYLISERQKEYCLNNTDLKCHQDCLLLPHCCKLGYSLEKSI